MRKWLISILAVFFLVVVCVSCQDSKTSSVITNSINIVWKGSYSDAPSEPEEGWAYYDTTKKMSYVWDGEEWQMIAKDSRTIIWKGELASAPSNPESGWAYYNSTEGKSYIWDGSIWQVIAKDGEAEVAPEASASSDSGNKLYSATYVGESTETISGVTYKVKSYAYGTGPIAYFYDFYKYYYLNDKLRRIEVFNHREGSDMDYLCTEFVDHLCGSRTKTDMTYGYYESGKLESIIYDTKSPDGNTKDEYHYYENGAKLSYSYYVNDKIKYEYTYYPNGIVKSLKDYSGECVYENKYYESGNRSARISYYESGMMYIRDEYDDSKSQYVKRRIYYYSDGMIKSEIEYHDYSNYTKKRIDYYLDGTIKYEYESYATGRLKKCFEYDSEGNLTKEEYDNEDGTLLLRAEYNTDGSLDNFSYDYISGYLQYYYSDSGYLYTYEDNKTTASSTSSSVYSSKEAYTDGQAKTLLENLRPAD